MRCFDIVYYCVLAAIMEAEGEKKKKGKGKASGGKKKAKKQVLPNPGKRLELKVLSIEALLPSIAITLHSIGMLPYV